MLSSLRLLYYSKDILDSLKENTSDLQLSTCWVHEHLKTIQISAVFQGRPIRAWGSDSNESIALAKALMELTERLHLKTHPISWTNASTGQIFSHRSMLNQHKILNSFMATTSGMAAHLCPKKAAHAALDEIIERHTLTKAMLESIAADTCDSNLFIWNGPLGRKVALCRHRSQMGGYLYGSAANISESKAIHSARRELSGIIAWSKNPANQDWLLKNTRPVSPSEIQAYHLRHELNLHLFDVRPSLQEISRKDIWIAELPRLPGFKDIKPLSVVRAFSPKLQPLFFGKLQNGPINPLAIDVDRVAPRTEYNVVA